MLNALLGQKLAIATEKPQTTRLNLVGVYAQDNPPTQIAFIDTPGLHRPHNALGRALVEHAKGGLADADVVVMVIEVGKNTRPDDLFEGEDAEVLALVRAAAGPSILVLNKVDRLRDKTRLLPLLERAAKHDFEAIVPLSALKKQNLQGLVKEIRERLPEGLTYAEGVLTDRPERFFAGELLREALIRKTRQEVPHGVAVVIERYEEGPKVLHISATVVVGKTSHKGIVIGRGGERLKEIASEARKGIEDLTGRKVFLEVWVKVVEGWTNSPARVEELTTEHSVAPEQQ